MSAACGRGFECDAGRAENVSGLCFKRYDCFSVFGDSEIGFRLSVQGQAFFGRDCDVYTRVSAARQGVAHDYGTLERVSGRGSQGQDGMHDEGAPDCGFRSCRTGQQPFFRRAGGTHGHDADASGKVGRHGDIYDGAIRRNISYPLPESEGRFAAPAERIQETSAGAGHATAEGRDTSLQAGVIGHEKVESLSGDGVKAAVGKKIVQRVGRSESGERENAFVHSEKDHSPRMGSLNPDAERAAWQHCFGNAEAEPHVPGGHAAQERCCRVDHGLHGESAAGLRSVEEYADVAAALKVFRNRDFLDCFSCLCLEPFVRQNGIPFNGDKSRAFIRQGKMHF